MRRARRRLFAAGLLLALVGVLLVPVLVPLSASNTGVSAAELPRIVHPVGGQAAEPVDQAPGAPAGPSVASRHAPMPPAGRTPPARYRTHASSSPPDCGTGRFHGSPKGRQPARLSWSRPGRRSVPSQSGRVTLDLELACPRMRAA